MRRRNRLVRSSEGSLNYSQQRGGNGGLALNALGTIMLILSFAVAILGYLGYRWLTRGERGSNSISALTTITGRN